ncbi:hypothetical protein MKW94_013184 [Papaver nudicaule]|uniref:Uncharacterized protein n=1 Tax=Papaver nudicaule TaxID=74823 RepID=A0AA41W1U1_PAPNU|nr:hypothetical protein [Papaver nudicaule]
MGNEQSGHHKNGAEKLKKPDGKNKDKIPEETSGVTDDVKNDSDIKDAAAEASVGLANVLPVSTDPSSQIGTAAETVTHNQVQNEIPVEKEISVDTKTSEQQAAQPKPVELTKAETFFYECKQEEPAAKIDAIPESSVVVEKAVPIPESSVVVEKPVAKTESTVVVEKPVASTESNVVAEKPIAKTEPSVVIEQPIAKAEDLVKDLEKPGPVLFQSLLNMGGDTSQPIGESGRTTLLNKETLEPQQKSTEKQVTESERVSTDTLNAPLIAKDEGSESARKEIVENEHLKRNKSFISSLLCCTAP